MKQNLHLISKNKNQVSLKTIKLFAVSSICATFLLFCLSFIFQITTNNKEAIAATDLNIQLTLFPTNSNENYKPAATAEISCQTDSLIVVLNSVEKNEINSGVISISNSNEAAKQNNLIKSIVLSKSKKIAENKFRFSVSLSGMPDEVMVEVRVSLNNEAHNGVEANKETVELINRVKLNRVSSAFIHPPAGLQTKDVKSKTAIAGWLPVSAAFKYRVRYRKTGTQGWKMGIVTAPGTQRPMVNLEPAATYEFQVQAFTTNQSFDSTGYSIIAFFDTPPSEIKSESGF